ncbi:MAG: NAD-glutamate dehydrogenase [Gammaproteobacteria bacterium]
MTATATDSSSTLIAQVDEIIGKKLSKTQAELVSKFSSNFYNSVAESDLIQRSADELYASILSLWHFCQEPVTPERGLIRVSNPNIEEHGWQSKHTVIELLYTDMPFMVDSIRMVLNRLDLNSHLMIHQPFAFKRNKNGRITDISIIRDDSDTVVETPIYIEVDRESDNERLNELKEAIENTLRDVYITVSEWLPMKEKMGQVIAEVSTSPYPKNKDSLKESIEFLRWIEHDHFTYMGYRYYDFKAQKGDILLSPQPENSLGLKRVKDKKQHEYMMSSLPKPAQRMVQNNTDLLIVSKTSTLSTVHRPAYIDYIGVKHFNDKGKVIGEHRFYGLYTSAAYNLTPASIPLLRQKVKDVIDQSNLSTKGHDARTLANILETYPRDELFQIETLRLLSISMGVLHMQERPSVKLFIRPDPFGRFFSCLVYVPKDVYTTKLRIQITQILKRHFKGMGDVQHTTFFSESILARTLYQINVEDMDTIKYDYAAIERDLTDACKTWDDKLSEPLCSVFTDEEGLRLSNLYKDAFPVSYQEETSSLTAVNDIRHLEMLSDDNKLAMMLYQPQEEERSRLRFKLYNLDEPASLSEVLPMLENMGCNVIGEVPHRITANDGRVRWIMDFYLAVDTIDAQKFEQIKDNFQQSFANVWSGDAEDDAFNGLILSANMNWREVSMLRGYAKYLLQIGFNLSQAYIEETLIKHSDISRQIVDLFNFRFGLDHEQPSADSYRRAATKVRRALDSVSNIDEDRILSRYIDVISATIRTYFFQLGEIVRPNIYVCFKLTPEKIPDVPKPIPMFEIFVYSPRVEGVHLRGGKVARGGLRWSDRREDFRTEILGLVKAQQVKNSVIVPVGAKGGFFCKRQHMLSDRDAIYQEGIACYQTFIKALLDVTDNYVDNDIVHPQNVVRYDESDPYLVVAADKGTAAFSDIANGISEEYNFWLGDAFASGGSVGYDHKKMGITARGAWESVKRHFREMAIDCQTTDFTCIGIGDMAGDVFGNGMLLSKHIRLVAAFNHMHIFLDPNPNAAKSYQERERLFNLPRSSWEDYDKRKISIGGGIYSRSEKSIELTPQIRELVGTDKKQMSPDELISMLLQAEVDLLWNGGIGTYVKASHESNSEVGDKANNGLRVNGNQLRCKIIGEGGNLGFTQQGRIEYMLNGGRCNTDFIDNAGGVDCSDKEVNIKILLNQIVDNGDMTIKQRNKLLADMTDEVAIIVLNDNYMQIQSISITESRSKITLKEYMRFINHMEKSGVLDRSLESIPSDDQLLERKAKGYGLTRGSLSVLLAYGKMELKEKLCVPEITNNPYYSKLLHNYFPEPLRKKYKQSMEDHRLRNEIIATELANSMVNYMGSNYADRINDETGASIVEIAACFSIAMEIFDVYTLWQEVRALDNKISTTVQHEILSRTQRLVRRATRWFLRHGDRSIPMQDYITYFKDDIHALSGTVAGVLEKREERQLAGITQKYVKAGVPKALAVKATYLSTIFSGLDIVEMAKSSGEDTNVVAELYYKLGAKLELHWFLDQIVLQPVENHWQAFARSAFREELDWQQRGLTVAVLQLTDSSANPEQRLRGWINENRELLQRWQTMVADFKSTNSHEFAKFSVALRELLILVQRCIEQTKALEN